MLRLYLWLLLLLLWLQYWWIRSIKTSPWQGLGLHQQPRVFPSNWCKLFTNSCHHHTSNIKEKDITQSIQLSIYISNNYLILLHIQSISTQHLLRSTILPHRKGIGPFTLLQSPSPSKALSSNVHIAILNYFSVFSLQPNDPSGFGLLYWRRHGGGCCVFHFVWMRDRRK